MSYEMPPLRPCPGCGTTMQADRSHVHAGAYDRFTCLSCDLVLTYRRSQAPAADPGNRDAKRR